MKKALYVIFAMFLVYSCSTNNESNTINNEETAMAAPIPPTNLTLTNISPTQIDLSWTDNSNNETGFKIERKKGTDPYAIVGSVNVNVTTFSDTNLIPNVTYAYKVYAFNANAKSSTNSNEVAVTTSTPIVAPTLTTTLPSSITTTTASSGGNIESDGGAIITVRGVVWSATTNPTITLTTNTINGTGSGSFTSAISGLIPSSTYYLRAYATNSAGTAYGNEVIFTTKTIPIPSNGLIGYWPFNGNANDESGNSNNGVRNQVSETLDRFGNSNAAFYFDGVTSSIDINIPNVPINNSPRTISGWFKGDSSLFLGSKSYICIFNYGQMSSLSRFSLYLYSKGYLNTITGSDFNNSDNVSIQNNHLDSKWYFFTIVYDGSSLRLYVNGELASTFLNPISVQLKTTNTVFRIGKRTLEDGIDENFKGAIDDVAIYNRALTQDEITTLYNSTGK
jgi:hypothetical protein